jgi:hypothetical protein
MMQFMDSTVLFFLLLWISPAIQAPAGGLSLRSPPTVSNIDAAAAPASVSEASNSTTANACTPAVAALAQGIKDNIAVQNNEVAGASTLGAMLSEDPVDPTLFAAGQASLLVFVKQGIAIRQNNQQIAPAGNAANPGIAMVAMAQMTELNLTMGLGMGGVSLARDNATIKMLLGDFKGGIEQNGKNLQAVSFDGDDETRKARKARANEVGIGYGKLHDGFFFYGDLIRNWHRRWFSSGYGCGTEVNCFCETSQDGGEENEDMSRAGDNSKMLHVLAMLGHELTISHSLS